MGRKPKTMEEVLEEVKIYLAMTAMAVICLASAEFVGSKRTMSFAAIVVAGVIFAHLFGSHLLSLWKGMRDSAKEAKLSKTRL